jgi:lipopolysaccharide export system permease protein
LDDAVRILDRHVLTETALAGGMATGAFLFVMVAGNFLQQVAGAIATGRVDGAQGLELVVLLFPGVTPYALPMGMLAGVLMAFGRMGAQHEITAMKASGRGLVRIARPALLLAAALAVFSAWLNLEVAPAANDRYHRILSGSARDNPAAIVTPGQINRRIPGVILRAAAREGDVLRDFWLWRVDANGRLTQSIHAQEARLTATESADGKAVLRVTLTEARMESRAPSEANRNAPAAFAMAKATTFEFPAGAVFQDGAVTRKLRWLTLGELLEAIEHGWQVTPTTPPEEVARSRMQASTQLMSHLASAFSIFTLSLLAVPLAVRVGRSETFVNAVVALLVALSYYLLSEMAKAVKDPAFRPDLLVWLPNLVVLALAVVLLRRASRH